MLLEKNKLGQLETIAENDDTQRWCTDIFFQRS